MQAMGEQVDASASTGKAQSTSHDARIVPRTLTPLLKSPHSDLGQQIESALTVEKATDSSRKHEEAGTAEPKKEIGGTKVIPPLRRSKTLGRSTPRRISLNPTLLLATRMQTSQSKELAEKMVAYESMMERFQLRKLERSNSYSGALIAPLSARTSNDAGTDEDGGFVLQPMPIRRSKSNSVEPGASRDQPVEAGTDGDAVDKQAQGIGSARAVMHSRRSTSDASLAFGKDASGLAPSRAVSLPISTRDEDDPIEPSEGVSVDQQVSEIGAFVTPRFQQSPKEPTHRKARWSTRRVLRGYLRKLRRWGRQLPQQLRSPLSPKSPLSMLRWIVLMSVCALNLVTLPLIPAYFATGNQLMTSLSILCEIVFMLDMLLTFNTSYYDPKTMMLVKSRKKIAVHYVTEGPFLLDLLSAIPMDLVLVMVGSSDMLHRKDSQQQILFHVIFRIPRLVMAMQLVDKLVWLSRVLRVGKELFAWLLYSRYSHLMRIVRMLTLIVLTAHYIACGWHLVTGDDPNAPNATALGSAVHVQYLSDLYYAVLLIQGQGEFRGTTPAQNLYSTIAVLVGSVVLAIVFGNVAMLVSNFNANSTKYQRKMEAVFATMNKLQLPQTLRERIHQYYEHLWDEYESLDGDLVKFSKELTHTLGLEVGLYRYMNLITTVSYWRDCSPDFVTQIVVNLVVRVYLPDDYVVRKGEIGEEMFMVNRGTCEVADAEIAFDRPFVKTPLPAPVGGATSDSGSEVSVRGGGASNPYRVAVLERRASRRWLRRRSSTSASSSADVSQSVSEETGEDSDRRPHRAAVSPGKRLPHANRIRAGHSFGEMALLMNYRRAANVRAVSYVEMCVLARPQFQQILARYPDDRRKVLCRMLFACVERRELPLSWGEVCEMVALKRGVSAVEVLDEGEHVSTDEIVNVLMEKVDRKVRDHSIVFGWAESQSSTALDTITAAQTSFRQRRKSRSSLTGQAGSLTAVLEQRTFEHSAEASPPPVSAMPSTQVQAIPTIDPQNADANLPDTQFDVLAARMLAIEHAHAQVMDMLRLITNKLDKPATTDREVYPSITSNDDPRQSAVYGPAPPPNRLTKSSGSSRQANYRRPPRPGLVTRLSRHLSPATSASRREDVPVDPSVSPSELADRLWKTAQPAVASPPVINGVPPSSAAPRVTLTTRLTRRFSLNGSGSPPKRRSSISGQALSSSSRLADRLWTGEETGSTATPTLDRRPSIGETRRPSSMGNLNRPNK